MNGRRWLLAMTMLAAVTTLGEAQGRGGPPPLPPRPPAGRGQALTPEQRQSIQQLRQQQRQEMRSEEHTSELQSQFQLVCRLLLEKKNEWEAFKKVISRRNIRRRITIPLTL